MSQHDFVIDNQLAPAARTDINSALQAVVSLNSVATEPATTYANMLWYDTANNTLKMRDEADAGWISIGMLDQTNGRFELMSDVVQAISSTSGPVAKKADGTEVLKLYPPSQSIAETATDNTYAMTPQRVLESILYNALGGGAQTLQDVAANRATGTTYQNTTGRPIQVSISGTANNFKPFSLSYDGVTWITVGGLPSNGRTVINQVVQDQQYYKLDGGTISSWAEMR